MVNHVIFFHTDKFTFLDGIHKWSGKQARTTSWKNLGVEPEEGMYYVWQAKLSLDEIEIPVEIYDGKEFQDGEIKIGITSNQGDIQVILPGRKLSHPYYNLTDY